MLDCKNGGLYVDCTVGGGGHALEILKASSPDGRLIGIDRDCEAIEKAGEVLADYGERVRLIQSNFRQLDEVLAGEKISAVDGILIDLGVSSRQLDAAERGFSFMKEGPLDMRMNQEEGESASELIERLSAGEIARILKEYGEERWAKKIARAIKDSLPLGTTTELAAVVARAVPKRFHPKNIHVATRTFQALRIAVNAELEGLDDYFLHAAGLLKEGGRMAVISFHSLEDRIVKRAFRQLSKVCICPPGLPICACGKKASVRLLARRAVTASAEEVARNPRARSAKMRGIERLPLLH